MNKIFNIKNSIFLLLLTVILTVGMTSAIAAIDTVKPEVTSVEIISITTVNQQGVTETIDRIHIRFSEEMDFTTLNSQTITVSENPSPLRVISGKITYDNNQKMVIFRPNDDLANLQREGNEFNVIINTGAKDKAGNSLLEISEWNMKTAKIVETTPSIETVATPAVVNNQEPVVNQVTGAVPTDTDTTKNNFPYLQVLIIAFLVIGIVAIIFAKTQNPKTKNTRKSTYLKKNPFGKVHSINEIEGIGEVYTKKLNDIGIENTKQLWEANTQELSSQIGVNQKTIQNWQQMAELTAVHGIGPQYAELLERSGINGITHLSHKDPKVLLRHIKKTQNTLKMNIQGNSIGNDIVTSWIKEARDHRFVK